jgi:CHAD domain-containing protein
VNAVPVTWTQDHLQAECLRQLALAGHWTRRAARSAEAIHRARTHLKSAEALLGLLRPTVSRATYRKARQSVLAVRRRLGASRDVSVNRQELLRAQRSGLINGRLCRPMESKWACELQSIVATSDCIEMAHRLTVAHDRLAAERLPIGRRTLRAGLRRLYRRAAASCRLALNDPSDANLHRCRRHTQRLRYALEYAEPWLPKRDQRLCRRTKTLGTRLGHCRDCRRLWRRIDKSALSPRQYRQLDDGLAARQRATLAKAVNDAQRIYRRKRRHFHGLST